ncbi:MAG: ATP-binding protein [Gemmatimonadota bacterium]
MDSAGRSAGPGPDDRDPGGALQGGRPAPLPDGLRKELFGTNREEYAPRRLTTYALLVGALGLVALRMEPLGSIGTIGLHAIGETVGASLAAVVAALSLLRYRYRGSRAFLLIAIGFGGAALLDLHGGVVAYLAGAWGLGEGVDDLLAWNWTAGRLFLACFLLAAPLQWGSRRVGRRSDVRPARWSAAVTVGAGGILLLVLLVLHQAPLPGAIAPEALLPRPAQLLPTIVGILAVAAMLHHGGWRGQAFEHWLLCALVTGALADGGFMLHSRAPYDAAAVGAQGAKLLGYLLALSGLAALARSAFRREIEVLSRGESARRSVEGALVERDAAEERLRHARARFELLLDRTSDLVHLSDAKGRILEVNRSWIQTLGRPDLDPARSDFLVLVHPRTRPRVSSALDRAGRGETVEDLEVLVHRADGSPIVLRGSFSACPDGEEKGLVQVVLRDETARVESERERESLRANLRALFESTGDAIWSVDRDFRLVTFNAAYALTVEALTGRAPQAGDALEDVVHSWEVGWFRNCYERAIAGSRFSASREEELGGVLRTYELYFHPFNTVDGIGGVVVFSKDVTRRKQTEEALRRAKRDAEEANRAKSQFMANMSHELRTPLNSVIGFSNILLRKREHLAEREAEFVERILVNGKHLLELINQILDLAKIEAGKMELEVEEVWLQQLVPSVLEQLEGHVGGRPVQLRSSWTADPLPLQTDPGKLRQILINLVGNAIKFTPSGEVTIAVACDPATRAPTAIRVRDEGVGIPPHRLETIFDAFSQADGTTTRRFGGTGLGLTISRSLCTFLGFELTVESEEGVGSVFSILLDPAAESSRNLGEPGPPALAGRKSGGRRPARGRPDGAGPRAPAGPEPSPTLTGLSGRSILIVEEDGDSRELLVEYLKDLGCRAEGASDALDALRLVRAQRPDLVITDLRMARMSGWDLLCAMRADPELSDIPVIVMGGVADPVGEPEAAGALDVMEPAVEQDALLRTIGRNMRQDSGRVLLIADDPSIRIPLQRHLREGGLVAHSVETTGAALASLERIQVDLILAGHGESLADRLGFLAKLRNLGTQAGVPVVILIEADLPEHEVAMLRKRPEGAGYRETTPVEQLKAALHAHFRVPSSGRASDA